MAKRVIRNIRLVECDTQVEAAGHIKETGDIIVVSGKNLESKFKSVFSQTSVDGIAQVVNASAPVKVTGISTFIEQGGLFTNGGANNLTLKYIGEEQRFIEFNYKVEAREDPAGIGADGTVNIFLAVSGANISHSKVTASVDAIHGSTASGSFIRLCLKDEVFELMTSRNTGGGNGAILGVVLSAKLL